MGSVSSLIEGNLAHGLPEVVEAVLDPFEARVGLVKSRVEVLPQMLDAVADVPEDFDRQIRSHTVRLAGQHTDCESAEFQCPLILAASRRGRLEGARSSIK